MPTKVVIMGAAGRDFHNFNVSFRDNPDYRVVAFTATQIPNIYGRTYPPALAGKLYPNGIPILPEEDLPEIVKREAVDQVVFAYSDVPHEYVMHKASFVLSLGADFRLMGPRSTMLKSKKPVIAVCAVRTGAGKSQTTRRVASILRNLGLNPVVVRHPMPYGELEKQVCQRFTKYEDLDKYQTTIEEREEYEPHIRAGTTVYSGIDYARILSEAEAEGDIVLWDGGNNDIPFYKPDLHITVVDPHRPGNEISYHPGETNLRMADVVVINKVETASERGRQIVRRNIELANPKAQVVEAASPISVDHPELIRGKRVLVIEDGPTLTHGEMKYGAGVIAAKKHGAAALVDPRPFAVGSLKDTFKKYPRIGTLLPAMGYGQSQVKELELTINASDAELVVIATPIDLRRITQLNKEAVRVSYELQEIGRPTLSDILEQFAARLRK
ncbi:MAG TPA: GTPase [Firmicutes bacterium]|nr:GTPase [Bacillota bacterium]